MDGYSTGIDLLWTASRLAGYRSQVAKQGSWMLLF